MSIIAALLCALLFLLTTAAPIETHHRCEGTDPTTTTCSFENLCYDGKHWLYYTGKTKPNIQFRVGTYDSSPLFPIEYMSPRDDSDVLWVDTPSFLFYRSHPNNYFHALLDDYIGLFYAMFYHQHGNVHNDNQILLFDENRPLGDDERFAEIRGVFSKRKMRRAKVFFKEMNAIRADPDDEDSMTEENPNPSTICFRQFAGGPARVQLGGPGLDKVEPSVVRNFRNFIVTMLGLPKIVAAPLNPMNIVVIDRRGTRKILNIDETVKAIQKKLPNANVTAVQFDKLPFATQVQTWSTAKVVVGMHGAGLANLVFLPPDSTLVEGQPYAVKRPLYQIIATRKAGINYYAWHNTNPRNTVHHPEVLPSYHISEEEKKRIINEPATIYQSMAGNMYWLTQDTVVDTEAIADLVHKAVFASQPRTEL